MTRTSLTLLVLVSMALPARAGNWPAWRGPQGNGVSSERGLPMKWSKTENVRWKTPLPGPGNSTPIIWGERIFLTGALDKGKRRTVMCFDRAGGKLLWQQEIPYDQPETTHDDNPYCSASPVTDGERVIAWHGSAGVVCYDFDGKQLWHRDLGKFEHVWGNASSPVLYGDLVILNCGPGERSFVVALDKRTGETVWQGDEPGGRFGHTPQEWIGSWSTPLLVRIDGRDELVVSLPQHIRAFDPQTGKELWRCEGLGDLVYTSAIAGDGLIVAMSGYHGPALAVRTGGEGDITQSHRLWVEPRNPQRIGSGVIIGEHLYLLNENGVAVCMEAKTGKTVWEERLTGSSWSSMVLADGNLYVIDRLGQSAVLKASPQFELRSKNALEETTLASPAVSDGKIFIRTYENLYCICNTGGD